MISKEIKPPDIRNNRIKIAEDIFGVFVEMCKIDYLNAHEVQWKSYTISYIPNMFLFRLFITLYYVYQTI